MVNSINSILLDTNILMDILENRHPHGPKSEEFMRYCTQNTIELCAAWHSFATVFYLLSKTFSSIVIRQMIQEINEVVHIVGVGQGDFLEALNMPIVDLEDAMQSAAAIAGSCDLIVTRDEKGFIHSPIPAISPEDFLLSR